MILLQNYVPFLQIAIALCLGSVMGIERTFAGKTAGMRTYGLVSMGSCLFIVISNLMNDVFQTIPNFNFEPMHLAAAIITGIGFLGAGLIIFKDSKISGLTTAAGLWMAAGVGIATGFGLYAVAIFSTFLTLFNFTILWSVEDRIKKLVKGDQEDSSSL